MSRRGRRQLDVNALVGQSTGQAVRVSAPTARRRNDHAGGANCPGDVQDVVDPAADVYCRRRRDRSACRRRRNRGPVPERGVIGQHGRHGARLGVGAHDDDATDQPAGPPGPGEPAPGDLPLEGDERDREQEGGEQPAARDEDLGQVAHGDDGRDARHDRVHDAFELLEPAGHTTGRVQAVMGEQGQPHRQREDGKAVEPEVVGGERHPPSQRAQQCREDHGRRHCDPVRGHEGRLRCHRTCAGHRHVTYRRKAADEIQPGEMLAGEGNCR